MRLLEMATVHEIESAGAIAGGVVQVFQVEWYVKQ
jgi:hypothetical protein